MGAHFEAFTDGILVTPLEPRYTQIGFNLISDQVCGGCRKIKPGLCEGHANDYAYGSVYAQAGMSLAYDGSLGKLVFGSPGAWDWSGTVVVADAEDGEGPVMTQPWSTTEPLR